MFRPIAWICALVLVSALGCTQRVVSTPGGGSGQAGSGGGDTGSSSSTTGTSSSADQQALDALSALQPSITSVYFTPASSIPENPPPSHVIFQQDPGVARDIFRATVDLPLYSPTNGGEMGSCPADFGITYTLEFFAGEESVAKVVLQPGGCYLAKFTNGVTLSESDPDTYFRILAAGLGIVESDIYPYMPPVVGGG